MTRPFKVDTIENAGDNWLIADFGVDVEDNKHYILTTDHIHASELAALGTAREQAELACKLLNAQYEAKSFEEKGGGFLLAINGSLLDIHWIAGKAIMQSTSIPLSEVEGLGELRDVLERLLDCKAIDHHTAGSEPLWEEARRVLGRE